MERITYLGKQVWPRVSRPQVVRRDSEGKFSKYSERIAREKRVLRNLYKVRWVIGGMAVVVAVGFGVQAVQNAQPLYAYNMLTAVAHAETIQPEVPVLDRIAKAESGGHQYNPRNGQVLMHVNADGSIDLCKYQINSIWFKKASELGYDLTKEADCTAFATWLFNNYGSGPWSSSKKNWDK